MHIYFFVLSISLSLFPSHLLSQASSSTDFSFEIQLPEETSVDDYEFFLLSTDNGFNHYTTCFVSTDTLSDRVILSGHLSYIVGGDNIDLVITRKEVLESEKYRQRFEARKNYYLHIVRVAWVKDHIQVISLDEKRPILEIAGEFVNKEYVVHTSYFEGPETLNQQQQFAYLFFEQWLKVPVK